MKRHQVKHPAQVAAIDRGETSKQALLTELVAHLRQNRTQLREEWARRITESRLLTAMTHEDIFIEATAVYDNYVAVLETGAVEALSEYARDLSERIVPRGSRRTKCWALCCCSATCWRAPCSRNTSPNSVC